MLSGGSNTHWWLNPWRTARVEVMACQNKGAGARRADLPCWAVFTHVVRSLMCWVVQLSTCCTQHSVKRSSPPSLQRPQTLSAIPSPSTASSHPRVGFHAALLVLYYDALLRCFYSSLAPLQMSSQANGVASSLTFEGVCIAGKPACSKFDIRCRDGVIASLEEHKPEQYDEESGTRFLSPSLCHPHIHLDKCFLLSHPKYADLQIEKGDFAEAMKLTSRFISIYSQFSSLILHRRSKDSV